MMTKDEWAEIRNTRVAQEVMGWKKKNIETVKGWGPHCWVWWGTNSGTQFPREKPIAQCLVDEFDPWGNLMWAWLIVESFRVGWQHKKAAAAIDLHITDHIPEDGTDCEATFQAPDIIPTSARADSMSKAICLAALKVAKWDRSKPQRDKRAKHEAQTIKAIKSIRRMP